MALHRLRSSASRLTQPRGQSDVTTGLTPVGGFIWALREVQGLRTPDELQEPLGPKSQKSEKNVSQASGPDP